MSRAILSHSCLLPLIFNPGVVSELLGRWIEKTPAHYADPLPLNNARRRVERKVMKLPLPRTHAGLPRMKCDQRSAAVLLVFPSFLADDGGAHHRVWLSVLAPDERFVSSLEPFFLGTRVTTGKKDAMPSFLRLVTRPAAAADADVRSTSGFCKVFHFLSPFFPSSFRCESVCVWGWVCVICVTHAVEQRRHKEL